MPRHAPFKIPSEPNSMNTKPVIGTSHTTAASKIACGGVELRSVPAPSPAPAIALPHCASDIKSQVHAMAPTTANRPAMIRIKILAALDANGFLKSQPMGFGKFAPREFGGLLAERLKAGLVPANPTLTFTIPKNGLPSISQCNSFLSSSKRSCF